MANGVNHHHRLNTTTRRSTGPGRVTKANAATTVVFREAVKASQSKKSAPLQRNPALSAGGPPRRSALSQALNKAVGGIDDLVSDLKMSRQRYKGPVEGVLLDCQVALSRIIIAECCGVLRPPSSVWAVL